MTTGSVLVLGAASWNRMVYVPDFPQGAAATITDAREFETVGSTGVGKAMALAALGCRPTLHCELGRDDHADLIRSACAARGISMLVDVQDAPTPHHLNIMDEKGGRYSLFLSNGAADPQIDEDRIASAIATADTIFLSLCGTSKKLLPLLNDTRAEILLDLHDYDGSNPWYDDFIAHADVIQVSDVALLASDTVIDRLLAGRTSQVIVTKAEIGAEVVTAHDRFKIAPCPAQLRDSNGAGDAFSVGLWYGQRIGFDVTQAGAFAAAAAAYAVESATLFPADVGPDMIKVRAGIGDP